MTVVVSLAAGDWNESADAVAAIAKDAGALFVQGRHVDHAIVHGATVRSVQRLDKGDSDHEPLLIRLDADGHEIVVLVWNVYVGQPPKKVRVRLRDLIREHSPDALLLQEAYRCGHVLAALAKHQRYHLIQGPNSGEGADCALLLRAGRRLASHGRLRMRERWTGPKHNLPKQPREFPRGRIPIAPGVVLRALSVHQATGGPTGRNGASVRESHARIVRWLAQPQHAHRTKEQHR